MKTLVYAATSIALLAYGASAQPITDSEALPVAEAYQSWADNKSGASSPSSRADGLDLIFPNGLDIEVGSVRFANERIQISRLTIPGQGYRVIIEKVILQQTAEGVLLSFDTARLLPADLGDPGIRLTGGEMKFVGQVQGTRACDWMDVLSEAKFAKALVAPVEPETLNSSSRKVVVAPAWRMDASDLTFTQMGSKICGVSGLLTSSASKIVSPGGKSFSLSGMNAEIILPLDADNAAAPSLTSVRLRAEEFNYSHQKEIPAVGIAKMDVGLDARTNTLSGLYSVLGSKHPFTETIDLGYLSLQLYNALTMVDARLTADAPILRIYAPGAVPARAVANFSRVGLSTAHGRGNADLKFFNGNTELNAGVELTGLGQLNISLDSVIAPYPAEVFAAAHRGQDIGFHALPDWRPVAASLTFTDTGLDKVVYNLSGIPAASYVDEIGRVLLQDLTGISLAIGRSFKDGLEQFLRASATGQEIAVTAQPDSVEPLSALIVKAIRSFSDFVDFMNLAQRDGGGK